GVAAGSHGTVVVDGTGSTFSMSGGLFIGDGGTGAMNITSGGTVSNAFAQIGSQANSTGTVLVDGTGSTWTINGTFVVGNGGTGVMNVTNGGAVMSNGGFSFLGEGPTGNGTVTVDGTGSSWTAHNLFVGGDTTQAQGTGLLSVTNGGLVTATAVTIWQTGTLEGNGTVASNVTSFGLVDPGTSNPGTLTITGNYTQKSAGTLKIDIGGLTAGVDSDLLQVDGAGGASLDGTLQLVRVNNFTPAPGDRVNIIDDSSGHTGTFSSLDYVNWGLIRPVPMYDEPNDVYVVFELSGTFKSQALTPNQLAVGDALDHAFADECLPLFTFAVLGNLPLADLPQAFDLIAPEEMAAMYETSFSRATVQSQNLQRRMDQIREAADPNCGPLVEINPAPIQDKNVAGKDVVPPAPAPEPETRFGTFAMGSGEYVTVHDNDENANGYKIRNGSFLGGFDYRLLRNFALGVYGGYVGSESELTGHGRIISDGGTVGGYATFFSHGFYLQGAGGAGWNTYDNLRQGFFGVTHGKTDGTELNAMGALGYDWSMHFNAANHPGSLTIGPTASVQYTNVNLDGYREHDSLIPLEFPDQSEDSLRSTIGAKAMICLQTDHGVMLRPEVRVAWLHEYNDRSYPINARFLGCPTIFTVHGPAVDEDAALVNAGLTIQFNPMVALFGHYDGIFGRNNYDNNSVSGGISLSF
ncbi:MAG TPA: autotransporter domain-containing protein, partial [Chthoniobacterales bacterium]|nr:autotransporter domain-containing protein [Chthoniobacterales bacterium]